MILPVQKFQRALQSLAVCLLLGAMLAKPSVLQAQLTIGVANLATVVNAYYPVSNIAGTVVTVGAGTGIAHTLAVNDRVLLVQMTGSTGVNGGKFEFTKVTAVSGNNITLNLVTRSYSFATEAVQLVWVPYDPISVTTLANILAKPWDGTTGGIVSVLTDGTLTLNGAVVADGAGFVGTEAPGDHIWGEGVYGGGGAGGGGGGGYGSNTMNAVGAPADYDGGGGGGSTQGAGGPGGPQTINASNGSKYGAGGSKDGLAGVTTPQAGGIGTPNGTAGTFGGGGGGAAGGTAGGLGGAYGGGGSGGVGIQGGGNPTGATYNGGAPFASEMGVGGAAGGGGGGVGGGGGGGGTGHHYGSGGGGASPAAAGCGGSITNFSFGGLGAINGVGATDGGRSPQQGYGVGHSGGGGGKYTGGGAGGGGRSFQTCGGGGGGGFQPAAGYHTYFNCDANGTCNDPRIWMGGGAPGGGKGGGIVLIKANTIAANNKTVIANGGNGTAPYGGGGGGMVIINQQGVTNGTLDMCAQGGSGSQGPAYFGSSGGGGGGVIWVNNASAVVSNINATAALPAVPNMTFCIGGGVGGAASSTPKDATYAGGGGCGGGGVTPVNPNEKIFNNSCSINLSVHTVVCNGPTYDVVIVANYSVPPPTGGITITTTNGGSITVPQTGSPQTITLSGFTPNGATGIDVTGFFVDEATCTTTLVDAFNAPPACNCPGPNCGTATFIRN